MSFVITNNVHYYDLTLDITIVSCFGRSDKMPTAEFFSFLSSHPFIFVLLHFMAIISFLLPEQGKKSGFKRNSLNVLNDLLHLCGAS